MPSVSNPASFSSIRNAFSLYATSSSFYAYRYGGDIIPSIPQFGAIGKGSIENPLKMSQFNGISAYLELNIISIAQGAYSYATEYGYNEFDGGGGTGSVSPSTSSIYGGPVVLGIYETYVSNVFSGVVFSVTGVQSNSGWTTLVLSGTYSNGSTTSTSYSRASATYSVYPSGSPPQTTWSFSGSTSVLGSLYNAGVTTAIATFF